MGLFDFIRSRKRRKLARKGFAQTSKIRRVEPAHARTPHMGRSFLAVLIPVAVFIGVWFTASFSILYRRSPPASRYVAGQVADRNIYSEVDFFVVDGVSTEARRRDAIRSVPLVFRINRTGPGESVVQEFRMVRESIAARMEKPKDVDDGEELKPEPPVRKHVADFVAGLSEEQAVTLERLFGAPEKGRLLGKSVTEALNRGVWGDALASLQTTGDGVPSAQTVVLVDEQNRKSECPVEDLQPKAAAIAEIVAQVSSATRINKTEESEALRGLLFDLLQPNVVPDPDATQAAQNSARTAVEDIKKLVPAGVLLIKRGVQVTQEDIDRLELHEKERHSRPSFHENPLEMVLIPGICLVLCLAAAKALQTLREDLIRDRGMVVLVGVVMIIQILLSRGIANVYYMNWSSSFFLFPIMPLSFAAMLLSPLVGLRVALWAGTFAGVIGALQNEQSLRLFVIGALTSMVAAVLMRRVRKRFHAFRTGVAVSATVFAVDVLFLFQTEIPLEVLPKIFGLALLNGIGMATLASTVLPFFEYVFGITTEISLLELSDLNHPLLKRLQLEAPGTYHHSLMVATLAEQAAEAIGADPLLARVCAYFHDIGKLSYPEYFTENARGADPHQELQPRMSSLVILNHVKEGIDLALKYKLKKPIREAIAQHHGTNLVFFFYHRAVTKQNGGGEGPIGEQDYRYPGPRPKRKEITLISIADSCEAAARSLEKATPAKINALVDEIVQKRIRDHQLDDADLTLGELAVAKETIARALGMMLHGRVRYPKEYDNEADLFEAVQETGSEEPEAPDEGSPPGSDDESPNGHASG